MTDWISFWDTSHSIYVNARHRDVHYRIIAEDLRTCVPSPHAIVMDYGCGEALHADLIAAAAAKLVLVEAAPGVVAGLAARFAAEPKIEVITPDRLVGFPEHSIDLIVLHSVVQYLSADTLHVLLVAFRRLLKRNGLLIAGDIIPPSQSPLSDAWSLIRLAGANGFLGAALVGLMRTLKSDYSRLRARLGIARYDQPTMMRRLADAGFSAERAVRNVGHNQGRMTVLARAA